MGGQGGNQSLFGFAGENLQRRRRVFGRRRGYREICRPAGFPGDYGFVFGGVGDFIEQRGAAFVDFGDFASVPYLVTVDRVAEQPVTDIAMVKAVAQARTKAAFCRISCFFIGYSSLVMVGLLV